MNLYNNLMGKDSQVCLSAVNKDNGYTLYLWVIEYQVLVPSVVVSTQMQMLWK